jgi:hypothetical protein
MFHVEQYNKQVYPHPLSLSFGKRDWGYPKPQTPNPKPQTPTSCFEIINLQLWSIEIPKVKTKKALIMKKILFGMFLLFSPMSAFFNLEKPQKLREQLKKAIDCFRNCKENCIKSQESKNQKHCRKNCKASCEKVFKNTPKFSQRRLLTDLNSLPDNFCLSQKDAILSKKEELIAFAKGPCSPVILTTGLYGSKLTVEINCEVFKRRNPSLFETCGWTHCTKAFFEVWKRVPEKEYELWPPTLSNSYLVLSAFLGNNECFAGLVTPRFDFSKPIEEAAQPMPGIKIRTFGFSRKTKDGSCGRNAHNNSDNVIQYDGFSSFFDMIQALERIGYSSGVSYQAIPYNFFLTYRHNEFSKSFRNSVKWLFENVGKKVVVSSFSFGNLNVLHSLKSFTIDERKMYFHNWISVGAPFLGAPEMTINMVAGDDSYSLIDGLVGFKYKSHLTTITNSLSSYDLSVVDPHQSFADRPWFEAVKKRIAYQNDSEKTTFENSGFPFLPKSSEICKEKKRSNDDDKCIFGLIEESETVVMQIKDKSYRFSDTKSLLEENNPFPRAVQLYEKYFTDKLIDFNPMIPVTLVYMNSLQTIKETRYRESFEESFENNAYPEEYRTIRVPGDGTVPAYSALIPGLKWAYEFDNKSAGGNEEPVKFLELCGVGFRKDTVYDQRNPDSPYQVLKNEYMGVECECNKEKYANHSECRHAVMISEEGFLSKLFDVLNSNSVASQEHISKIEAMNEEEYKRDISDCKHLVSNAFE